MSLDLGLLGERENIGSHELRERFAIEHDCTCIVVTIYMASSRKMDDTIEVPGPALAPELWASIGRVWAYVVDHKSYNHLSNRDDILNKYNNADDIMSLLKAMTYHATSDADDAKDGFVECAAKIAAIAMYFGTNK